MSPIELAAEAAQAMAGGHGMILVIPKGSLPKTFPKGELLNEMRRNGVVERTYRFEPLRVLDWLVANGLVQYERTGERTLTFKECAPA